MNAKEIRQSFLDFFREKEHTIVPSSSLMPTAPNLLFTNAGMNQFVPFFLGTQNAPYDPPRAADTQKCIRAGGKHNDLEDVGFDTYHHTFFEMLGNWSFGNYFKKEAITWAWELLVERWGFPPQRLYATVYKPDDGDPADFDQEAYDHWRAIFEKVGLDPAVHIVYGNKKDNFWMMGDTGPCGPCSEIHMDLTPAGDTKGALVNQDDPACIEIWNLVFIQYNAEEDGSFRPLPACHVDTGMGFERACSIIQGTKGLTDFSTLCSNYNTDVFTPIFDRLTELSGRPYQGTMPAERSGLNEIEQCDVAFRVIADHLRTGSLSIADGILPGNKGRNATLRAILRRAVRYGRELGFDGGEPFLSKLVPVLVGQLGDVFPELRERQDKIAHELDKEETLFNRTLDRGLKLFESDCLKTGNDTRFPPERVVKLWETYGFPLELTKVLLDERGLSADKDEVERLIKEHKETGSGGKSGSVIRAVSIETDVKSDFVGYENEQAEAELLDVIEEDGAIVAIVSKSPLYVEMGGQVGDTGWLSIDGEEIEIVGTTGVGDALCLHLDQKPPRSSGSVMIQIDTTRRRDVEKHHTATHIMHWALHQHVSTEASQQGSFVGVDHLRFDFNSDALTKEQIAAVEEAVNAKVNEGAPVIWTEVPHADVRERPDVMQFFGDKYGELVRVVQIGGDQGSLNGYSMELCGGTHVRNTADIGLFKIKHEGAIAAGIRRIEAVCGEAAENYVAERREALLQSEIATLEERLQATNAKLGDDAIAAPDSDESTSIPVLEAHRDAIKHAAIEAEKNLKKKLAGQAASRADELLGALIAEAQGSIVKKFEGDAALLQPMMNSLKKRGFDGAAVLALVDGARVHLGTYVHQSKTGDHQAGKLIQELAPIVGGKGGGKSDMARGAGNDPSKVDELLTRARELLA